jgi:hypothetical protein
MKYVDKKGKTYEISYSQRLQTQANRIARQKNQLLFAILMILVLLTLGAGWMAFRISHADLLTQLVLALQAMA